MFEKAARMKLRFNYKGVLTVEDLWDCTQTALDTIYKELKKLLKNVSEESLLNETTDEDKELMLKLDIVKYIFTVKKAEKEARLESAKKAEYKKKLLEIKARKQDQNLESMSEEELDALLAGL